MKLNDFIKQDPTPKKTGYKVVVGNTPKEQELEKQASQAVVLQTNVDELRLKVSELEKENDFLKEQVKINQHEKNEFKAKAASLEDIKVQLIEKENRLTDVLEESYELSNKNSQNKDQIEKLERELNDVTGNYNVSKRENESIQQSLDSVTVKFNGLSSELNTIKDFSDKIQIEYNKIRDVNTGLMEERANLSKLKAEFEAKSIRLGEELNQANDKIRELKINLAKFTKTDINKDEKLSKLSSENTKLNKDLDSSFQKNKTYKSELNEVYKDMEDLSQVTQLYKQELSRQKRESAEWNIAKQQLKLGNAHTYPNKLGFGASPFFKLGEEK